MLAHMALCSKDMAWGRESINGFAVKPHDLKLELREAFQKVFSMANIIKSVLVQEKNTMSLPLAGFVYYPLICLLPPAHRCPKVADDCLLVLLPHQFRTGSHSLLILLFILLFFNQIFTWKQKDSTLFPCFKMMFSSQCTEIELI